MTCPGCGQPCSDLEPGHEATITSDPAGRPVVICSSGITATVPQVSKVNEVNASDGGGPP